MKASITLRILSRNRKEFLREALLSAFTQNEPFASVELYDNASTFDVPSLTAEYPLLKIRGLSNPVAVRENLRRALVDPPSTPWLCVFHDDDIFEPDFTSQLQEAIGKYPGAAAVSCNGTVIDRDGNRKNPLLPQVKQDLIFENPPDLARWYCDGFVPFPPTVYRWNEQLGPDLDGCEELGRCIDVAFLARVNKLAPIVVLAKPLFLYRRHPEQDSMDFQWWEETKRWELQIGLCRQDLAARRHVKHKCSDRLTSRWLNAWLRNEPRPEALNLRHFSLSSFHRFVRNNKIRILKRLLPGRGGR